MTNIDVVSDDASSAKTPLLASTSSTPTATAAAASTAQDASSSSMEYSSPPPPSQQPQQDFGLSEETNQNSFLSHWKHRIINAKCCRHIMVIFTDEGGNAESVVWGLATIFGVGMVLGLIFPPASQEGGWGRFVSAMLGYTYFMAWSVSFYPQVCSNYRRKHTHGLSVDFSLLNVFGFLCYAIFNCSLYWSTDIQAEYARRHNGNANLVQPNDVAFALHALLLASVTLGQIVYYDGIRGSGSVQPSPATVIALSVMLFAAGGYVLLILVTGGGGGGDGRLNWLDFLYTLADFKVGITIVKYIPQVVLNFRRRSTEGWNIWNVLLDFTGGMLSVVQLVLDSWRSGDWGGITGDPAKFALGFVSIFFDLIFFLQHYVLFPRRRVGDSEEQGAEVEAIDDVHRSILDGEGTLL